MDAVEDLVSDGAGLVADAVRGTGAVVADAIEGADDLIEGARRAGLRKLFALLVVLVVGAAIFKYVKSQQDQASSEGIAA